jgi:hypothetical protein
MSSAGFETRAQEVRSRYMDEVYQGLGGQTLVSSYIGCHREGVYFISRYHEMKSIGTLS